MNTSTDGEWMRVEDALALLGMGQADAIEAICLRASNGLIEAKAKRYIDGTGGRFDNVKLPTEFWWSAREIENWRTGDLATRSPDSGARLQAFGVTFRRLDIEEMISPAPQGANGASLSAPRALGQHATIGEAMLALSVLTTPTDGEWMSAQEALDFLMTHLRMGYGEAVRTLVTRASVGRIKARAELYIRDGEPNSDADVPLGFWEGREALEENWAAGDFETSRDTIRLQAFGVEFRRSDIERMKPASAANPSPAPSSVEQTSPPASRKVFLVHGRDENARNEVALFLNKIGLEDIVLHQRPNRGRHLLTKFQEEAEGASFAVILMTPDDDGGLVGEPQQRRARQNVVFELGFFIGKLETPHVAALIGPGVEKPSDFDGICWIEFGRGPKWKTELARELKAAGVPFDPDEILHA